MELVRKGDAIKASGFNEIIKNVNALNRAVSVPNNGNVNKGQFSLGRDSKAFDIVLATSSNDGVNDVMVAKFSGGQLIRKQPIDSSVKPLKYKTENINISASSSIAFKDGDEVGILITQVSSDTATPEAPDGTIKGDIVNIASISSEDPNIIKLGVFEKRKRNGESSTNINYLSYTHSPELVDLKTDVPLFINKAENLPTDEEIAQDPSLAPTSDQLDQKLRLRISSMIIWMGEADGLMLGVDSKDALALLPTSILLDDTGKPIQPDPLNPTIIVNPQGDPIGGGGGGGDGGGDSRLEFNLPLKKEGTQVSLKISSDPRNGGLGQKLKIGVLNGALDIAAITLASISAADNSISITGTDLNQIEVKRSSRKYDHGWGLSLGIGLVNDGLIIGGTALQITGVKGILTKPDSKTIELRLNSESTKFIFGSALGLKLDGAGDLALDVKPCQKGYFQAPIKITAVSDVMSEATVGLNYKAPLKLTQEVDADGDPWLTVGMVAPLTLNAQSDMALALNEEASWIVIGGYSFGAKLYIDPNSRLAVKLLT